MPEHSVRGKHESPQRWGPTAGWTLCSATRWVCTRWWENAKQWHDWRRPWCTREAAPRVRCRRPHGGSRPSRNCQVVHITCRQRFPRNDRTTSASVRCSRKRSPSSWTKRNSFATIIRRYRPSSVRFWHEKCERRLSCCTWNGEWWVNHLLTYNYNFRYIY